MSATAAGGDMAKKMVEIIWDAEHNRFRTPDGKAYLEYSVRPVANSLPKQQQQDEARKSELQLQVMDMQHTFVPSSFRGQGVAARLCVAAFQHAKDKGYLVLPTCSYISGTFLPRNSEWNDLLSQESETRSGL